MIRDISKDAGEPTTGITVRLNLDERERDLLRKALDEYPGD